MITSAGLVLAATFGVLATLPLVFLVELGFTVAVGVILDTLIVRSVLVTAINLDLGNKIWWPSKLDRGREPHPRVRAAADPPRGRPRLALRGREVHHPEWLHDRDTITVTVMKLSTALMYNGNPRDAADQVAALEQAGLDTVWVAEAYGFDSPTLMGYLAAKTETVEIGSAILNVYSRTPALLAQTAAGLDNVSGGRAILGLGASGPQVVEGWHGMPYTKPLGRTREAIEIIRAAMRREKLEFQGKSFTLPLPADEGTGLGKPLKMLTHPERDSVPIYIAALGQKSVEGTAEYADGWLPFLYTPEGAAKVWGDALAAGGAKRSADLAPLEIAAGGMVAVGDDVKGLLDFARPLFALYIGGMGARGKNFYNDLACQYGYEKEAKEIQDLYLDGKKKEAEAAVPLEILEQANLVGPESYVKERIEAFREAGVTNLQITPASDDNPALVRQLKEWVS